MNLIVDSFERDGAQQVAGWFFVGEGTQREYAGEVAECMYNQFRLALCKAIAETEGCKLGTGRDLDDATYERVCFACSLMTGVVMLRNVGHVENAKGEKEACLRYELHEFQFPMTSTKLKQEIRSKLKSIESVQHVESAAVHSGHPPPASEVVDLISDCDEQDDGPIIFLPMVAKTPPSQAISTVVKAPTSSPILVNDELALSESNSRGDMHEHAELERQAEREWKQKSCYQRWVTEGESCKKDATYCTSHFDFLENERIDLYASLIPHFTATNPNIRADVGTPKQSNSTTRRTAASGDVDMKVEHINVENGGPLATAARSRACRMETRTKKQAEKQAEVPPRQKELASAFAELRVCVLERAPAFLLAASEHVSVCPQCSSSTKKQEKELEAQRDGVAVADAGSDPENGEQDRGMLRALNAEGLGGACGACSLARHWHEYEEACKTHGALVQRAHARAQHEPRSQANGGGRGQEILRCCKWFVNNTVLATIVNLALRRSHREGKDATPLRGILVGVTRANHCVVERALVANSWNGAGGLDDAAGLLRNAQCDGLVVLGYFRVAVAGSDPENGEQDRVVLRELNAEGLGLWCSVQEVDQVVSVSEFVKFVSFGAEAQVASPIEWKVVQEPFLPCRVFEHWATSMQASSTDRGQAAGVLAAVAAAALVRLATVNLRVQQAYIKRQLSLSALTLTRPNADDCLANFLVSAQRDVVVSTTSESSGDCRICTGALWLHDLGDMMLF